MFSLGDAFGARPRPPSVHGAAHGRAAGHDSMPFSVAAVPPPASSGDQWRDRMAGLDVAFQPIVNIHTGACYGYEALARHTDRLGFHSIAAFFDECHALGVLVEMETALREKAVAKFRRLDHWRQTKLFLNMDARGLENEGTRPHLLRRMLDSHGIEANQVVLEISEGRPGGDPAAAAAIFAHYKRSNFRFAADDFGSGFSGLQLLYFAPPDFLKLHRSFIHDILKDSRKKLFLSQIVNTAHLMGVVVLAEGVETEQDYLLCKEIGCNLIQGNLVQPPELDTALLLSRYEAVERMSRRERRQSVSDQKLIGDQVSPLSPIRLDSSMEEVFERFRSDKSVTFFPVVDSAGEPVGLVREVELKDYTYSLYGKSLISNKTLGRRLKDFVTRSPIADINTPAEHILLAYSAVEKSEGIIIVDDMKYVGFLSAHSLLRVINEKNLAAARDQNPLTKLAGNNLIHEYVSDALAAVERAYVLAYFDFDNFKPFNDKYGFRQGDRAILLFGESLSKTLPRDTCFPAHVGGDDFFGGFCREDFDGCFATVSELCATFAHDVESFYDDETRRQGHIVGQDRMGNVVRFPLMTVSAAVVHLPAGRPVFSIDDVSQLIAELKKEAKKSPDHVAAASLVMS